MSRGARRTGGGITVANHGARAGRRGLRLLLYAIVLGVVVGVAWTHRRDVILAVRLLPKASLWWQAGGALAIAGVYLCRAGVYRIPLALFGHRARLGFLWAAALAATTTHQLLPSGGASGYAFLTWAMHRDGLPGGQASLVALIDTLSYAVATATLVVAALAYLAVGGHLAIHALSGYVAGGLTLVAIAAWVYWLQRDPDRLAAAALWVARHVGALVGRQMPERPVREFIDEYRAGKRLIARRRAAFAAMLALQYLALACDSAALYAAFLALHVAPGAWSVVMGFVIAMSGMAFVGAPGGGGTFEALMTGFFASQGMPTAQALAATVLYRIVAFWAPAVVGVAVIAWLRRRPAPRHARARP